MVEILADVDVAEDLVTTGLFGSFYYLAAVVVVMADFLAADADAKMDAVPTAVNG